MSPFFPLPHARAASLRPALPGDAAVVRAAHLEHRRSLFAGWPPALLERMAAQQHEAQERQVADDHPSAERWTIALDGRAVGGLCLDRGALPWRLVDVALVAEAQGQGLGAAAIRAVVAAADEAGAAVALHVGIDNPRAEALYRRLGFADADGGTPTHRHLLRAAR